MKLRLVLLAWLCATCVAWAQATKYDGVAAYVNNKVVTIDTVLKQLHSHFDFAAVPDHEVPVRMREYFPVVRDLIIDRMLILQEYEDSGSNLPSAYFNARIEEILSADYGGDEAKLKEALRRANMTYDEWVKQVREDVIVQAMRQLQVGKKIMVSPRRVKEYFAEHMDDFAKETGTRVRTILITPDQGEAVANEVMAALKAGGDFAELAKKYSSDSQAAEGGDWGYVNPKEAFAPMIAEALNGLKNGAYSDILESAGYRFIVQKVDVRRGERPQLKDVWSEVESAVRAQLGQERYKDWIEGLRKKAYIRTVESPI